MTISKYSSKHMIILPVLFLALTLFLTTFSENLMEIPETLQNGFLLIFSMPGHILLSVYVLATMGRKSFSDNEMKFHFRWRDLPFGILFGILTIVLSALISIVLPAATASATNFVFYEMDPVLFIYILFAGIAAPVVEELVFRGFLWKILEEKKIHKILILLITSLLFAGMHMDIERLPVLFAGGLVYGILRMKTGSISRSLIAHIANNLTITIITLIIPLIMRS